jgi:uncharacterized RDD family membrane protein YckC
MNHLNIETTHHVQIDYPPAGIGVRIGAFLLDIFIQGIYLLFTLTLVFEVAPGSGWLIILVTLLPVLFYHLAFALLFNGQSLGKKALDIKVIKTDGTPATFGSYLLRWIFRLIEITASTGMIAFFTILFNGKGQRLGDIAAGTTVVKTKKSTDLSDTLYADIEERYTPTYSEVAILDDNDISVIKEVLNDGGQYDRRTYEVMLLKTRNAIQRKMGIDTPQEKNPIEFLRTVVKDYNIIHG